VISDLTNVIQVTGLENAVVALKADGTVWAWGDGGQSETANVGTSSYAMQVTGFPAGTKIVKIEGGDFNVLCLDDQGYLWNWGRGNTGTIGDGQNVNRNYPVRVIDVGATYPTTLYLKDVVDMAAGQTVMLALLKSGKVAYWGGSPYVLNYVPNPTNTGDLTDIAFIGSGDNHGLFMKADGTLYTWRENGAGQLGLGNTTDRTYPVEVLPRPYKIKLPCPDAYLGPDITLCNPLSANLYAGSQSPTFKYEWYLNGVLLSDPATNYANQSTFTANAPGTYKVVITDTSQVFNCTPCLPCEDEVIISTSTPAPVNATFCAPPASSVTLGVNDPGTTFDWYSVSTGGTLLASGTNSYTTSPLSATTTYYVQDTRTYTYNNASSYLYPPTQSGLTQVDQCVSNSHTPFRMVFTVHQTLTLASVDVVKVGTGNCSGGVVNSQLRLDKLTAPGGTVESFQTIDITLNCGALASSAVLNTVPLNLTLAPGYYRLQWNSSFCSARNYQGAVYPTGVPGLITFNNPAVSSSYWTSSFFNWTITAQQNCGRIPVQAILTSSCPTPVRLLFFSGNKVGNSSLISWSTTREENNAWFEVERSVNVNDFVTIGKVDAVKKSSSVTNYSYIDPEIESSSVFYYRLKQVLETHSVICHKQQEVPDW
jgi:hypothetical protein